MQILNTSVECFQLPLSWVNEWAKPQLTSTNVGTDMTGPFHDTCVNNWKCFPQESRTSRSWELLTFKISSVFRELYQIQSPGYYKTELAYKVVWELNEV